MVGRNMFAVRYCNQCQRTLLRSECVSEPEGLYGPELLCRHCNGLVKSRFTAIGWLFVLSGAVVLGVAIWWWQVWA